MAPASRNRVSSSKKISRKSKELHGETPVLAGAVGAGIDDFLNSEIADPHGIEVKVDRKHVFLMVFGMLFVGSILFTVGYVYGVKKSSAASNNHYMPGQGQLLSGPPEESGSVAVTASAHAEFAQLPVRPNSPPLTEKQKEIVDMTLKKIQADQEAIEDALLKQKELTSAVQDLLVSRNKGEMPKPQSIEKISDAVSVVVDSMKLYTVQLGAYQKRSEASEKIEQLKDIGQKPTLVEVDIPGKGRWFRIRVGRFVDMKSAEHYRIELSKRLNVESFVTNF